MKTGVFSFTVVILLGITACRQEPDTPAAGNAPEDSQALFDGVSFDGWEGVNEFFRIEDAAIVAGSMQKPIPQNEFLCTVSRFSDFRLTLETRLSDESANAGIQFHTERVPDSHEVIGYQADIGKGYWGGIYDESRRNRVLVAADTALIDQILNIDGWNTYLLEAVGSRFRIEINGKETVTYEEEDPEIPLEGHICLQIHSGPPGEAWYESIMLETLN